MSEEQRKKIVEARALSDRNGGLAAAVAHLYGPLKTNRISR